LQGSPDHCRTSLYSKTFCRKKVSQKTFLNFQKCCQVYQYFDRRRDQSIWIVSVATATLAEELGEEYAGAAPPALPGRGRPRRAAGPCCFGSPPRGEKRSEVLLLLDLRTSLPAGSRVMRRWFLSLLPIWEHLSRLFGSLLSSLRLLKSLRLVFILRHIPTRRTLTLLSPVGTRRSFAASRRRTTGVPSTEAGFRRRSSVAGTVAFARPAELAQALGGVLYPRRSGQAVFAHRIDLSGGVLGQTRFANRIADRVRALSAKASLLQGLVAAIDFIASIGAPYACSEISAVRHPEWPIRSRRLC